MSYELIETIEVGSGGAASIEFTSIPQDGTDLLLKLSLRTDGTGGIDWGFVQFNGESSETNYTTKLLYGTGSSPGSFSETQYLTPISDAGTTSNTFNSGTVLISNYTSSNSKSWSADGVTENNDTGAYQVLIAGNWNNTSAITSLKIVEHLEGANFLEYSSASLYKITAGDSGQLAQPRATGGTTSFAGGYWYHTFTGSGTFTPSEALTADILVVGGGGGGGNPQTGVSYSNGQGGGGAGEVQTLSSQSLTATGYTVTVGGGGTGYADGSSSSFSTLATAIGGGRGGQWQNSGSANDGGSGGGSGGGTGNTTPGSAIGTGLGNAGGNGYNGSQEISETGGGGGGAGAAGNNGVANDGPAGGAGYQWLNGSYYAGGGGGSGFAAPRSAGGIGGGGEGAQYQSGSIASRSPTAGTANTGGGGGGGIYHDQFDPSTVQLNGAAGGSGVVIVRYAA